MADPKTPEDVLRKAVDALEKLTGRKTFVLVRRFDHLLPERAFSEFERVGGGAAELDVVLESDGGDADAAYKSALVMRSRCEGMRVLVPSWAKSAATLFALSADTIVMPPAIAELGPLDAQVTDPRNPATSMSALDGYQSVEYIRDYALQTQHLAVMQMMERTQARVPLGDILNHASAFANDVVSPIMSQVRPLDFGGWGRTLDIGKDYAGRLLARFNMAESSRNPDEVAYSLVYDYHHHGFVIDLGEASQLGFTTEAMSSDVHKATGSLVEAAFDCRQEVCEEGRHVTRPGYTGFAPAKPTQAKSGPTRKEKEVKTNGAQDAEDVRDLRHHTVREGQGPSTDGG